MRPPIEHALLQVLNVLNKGIQTPSLADRAYSRAGSGSGIALLPPQIRSEFETILTRLSIWAGSMGVLAPSHASLDERLHSGDHDEIRDVLCHLLGRLKETLQLAMEPPAQESEGESEGSDPSDSDSLVSLDMADNVLGMEGRPPLDASPVVKANDIISRLYRLSSAIRKPVSSRENERVRKFAQDLVNRPDMQSQAEELDSLGSFARWLTGYKYPKAPQPLVERLVSSVAFRRARLLYRHRHQSKLQQGVPKVVRERGNDFHMNPERAAAAAQGLAGNVPALGFDPGPSPSVVFSATVASSVDRRRYQSFGKSVPLSGITQTAVNRRRNLDVPPYSGPTDESSDQAFCPYCTRAIDMKETREPRWTRHILKDIEPYICLFPDCGDDGLSFRSSDEWLRHMQQHTLVWSCQIVGHESEVYRSSEELEDHIRSAHSDSVTDSQIPYLVRSSARPHPDLFSVLASSWNLAATGASDNPTEPRASPVCILCQEEIGSQSGTESEGNLCDHILNHLEEMALFSLPPTEHTEDGRSMASGKKTRGTAQDISDLPPAEFDDDNGGAALSPSWQLYRKEGVLPRLSGSPDEETLQRVYREVQNMRLADDPSLEPSDREADPILGHFTKSSPYCATHTCQYLLRIADAEGEAPAFCHLPKAKDVPFCAEHMKCGRPHCPEQGFYEQAGERAVSTDSHVLPWFCWRHRCQEGGCNRGIDNNQQKRCARHALTLPQGWPFIKQHKLSDVDLEFNKARNRFISLSGIPMKWEDPTLLDNALQVVPLDQIYEEADTENLQFLEEAISAGQWPEWGYQDCVVRTLLRWFKRDFFTWVNNPVCSVCLSPTIALGMTPPTDQETVHGAMRVELYECHNGRCGAKQRFPRYSSAVKLLETRRGRVGEWTNCFGFLCRAIGSRVRWVWNSEDHTWLEIYSEHQDRWVHADVCEDAWDKPLLYSKGWGKRMAYCIAFSLDGATDVTGRYVVEEAHALPRDICSETQLTEILAEITAMRREGRSDEVKARLVKEDEIEAEQLMSGSPV
ncbi:hypothetical protein CHGG_02174 [Chaetomium globosum CBS 148.51]|uniref:Transglutaminase-like domain-containing protein n=1 Tax=Chaetomium globosum (strain ATCC 6205 / CBS 148.51 / DSM 1962 / NBRC 6347 / NRRL 1970) TaxID=306901 RepID=Q2HC80_CHAGB|nr:uncharacterized protein CHGG_02174 [Chaetomium globosum CBS 148.51]EAQ90239.1 hypothetical protein CHGG_02174 [Chaetomium globosum CBS 148.51]